MSRSPSLSAESYPDDCWTFCNTTALAGLAMLDRVHRRRPPVSRAGLGRLREAASRRRRDRPARVALHARCADRRGARGLVDLDERLEPAPRRRGVRERPVHPRAPRARRELPRLRVGARMAARRAHASRRRLGAHRPRCSTRARARAGSRSSVRAPSTTTRGAIRCSHRWSSPASRTVSTPRGAPAMPLATRSSSTR